MHTYYRLCKGGSKMAFELVQQIVNKESESARKKSREQLDLIREENRVSWLVLRQMAVKLFGKEKGLSLSEIRKLKEEIKRNGSS
jgi:hypothetical protein